MRALYVTIIVIILFVVPFGVENYAQSSIGIRAGSVISNPSYTAEMPDPRIVLDHATNFAVNGIIEARLEEHFSLVLEPGFVRKGLSMSNQNYYPFLNIAASADYIEFPVLLRMDFPAGFVNPYLYIGPGIAYRISEKVEAGGSRWLTPGFFARYDIGLNLGAGIAVPVMSDLSVFLDGRYSHGMNNLLKNGGSMKWSDLRIGGGLLLAIE